MIGPHVPSPFEDRITSYSKWHITVRGSVTHFRSAPRDPRNVSSWHYPEAFESKNKFCLLRCCGREMIAPSSSLHEPKLPYAKTASFSRLVALLAAFRCRS